MGGNTNSSHRFPYSHPSLHFTPPQRHAATEKHHHRNKVAAPAEAVVVGFRLCIPQATNVGNSLRSSSTLFFSSPFVFNPSFVTSAVTLIGFFVSSDFRLLNLEMDSYELGKASYVMNLVWTVVCWQVSIFAGPGLVSELSTMFANVIFAVGFPVNTIIAIIIFNDRINSVKEISMALAVWGVISYAYQQYLDDCNGKTKRSKVSEV
ncbi:hypothetical protein V6N13_030007 [Hibiscus sabdariffa]|uniref:Uncharacterized protein n=2 Tax=Hibiscus sabdariffa TaxID=183260 RepID=A0ABR2T8C0_9ROSI